jgi:hypothetical protein
MDDRGEDTVVMLRLRVKAISFSVYDEFCVVVVLILAGAEWRKETRDEREREREYS